MISVAGRCNSGGSGRVSAMSKDCRIVNGGGGGVVVVGGFVNHCEQVLGDQNEMVMAASKIAVVSGSDQTVASINHRVYPPSSNELNKLKELAVDNIMLLEEFSQTSTMQNEKILQLTNEVQYVSDNLNVTCSDLKVKFIMV